MKYLSLCSGIEAASVAWQALGWQAMAFAEIEKFPSAVLAYHYPNVVNLGDINQISKKDFNIKNEKIGLIVGGTPCQSFSIAGKRAGLADNRGNLTLTFFNIVKELRPKWLVWENVPGVLSIDRGRTFGSILGQLAECGYGFAYRILDAQYFGIPQRRRRVFVVGYFGDWRPATSVLFEQQSLFGNNKKSQQTQQKITAPFLYSSYGAKQEKFGGNKIFNLNQVSSHKNIKIFGGGKTTGELDVFPTLAAGNRCNFGSEAFISQFSQNNTNDLAPFDVSVRRLTPLEYERLQGFPDNYTKIPWNGKALENCPDGLRYKAIGNSMAIAVMRWLGERIFCVENFITEFNA